MTGISWQQELLNTALALLVIIITLRLTWAVGQRLTVYWAIRQKRREIELVSANEFYKIYGEFFAVHRLWSYATINSLEKPITTRWELLQKASQNEGALEALFVKLSSERHLSNEEIEILGKFRQAFQSLRAAIRDGMDLGWYYDAHPEYLSFKRLAYLMACIINSDWQQDRTAELITADSLTSITSNKWENTWILSEDDWIRLQLQSQN